jgi:hypothetical protein
MFPKTKLAASLSHYGNASRHTIVNFTGVTAQ